MVDPIYNLFSITDLILIFSIFLNIGLIITYFIDIKPKLKRKEIKKDV